MKCFKNIFINIRKGVFFPVFFVMLAVALLGVLNNEGLAKVSKSIFTFSLKNFGFLYQIIILISFFIIIIIFLSKTGNIRLGGEKAKPKFSFASWFAMALTGGITIGIVAWGVNEPLVYYGDIYGELQSTGILKETRSAEIFALARSFFHWSFVPYSVYTLSGILTGYMHFNKKEALSINSCFIPILDKKAYNSNFCNIINIFAALAIILSMSSGLGTGITLVSTGLELNYGIRKTTTLWISLAIITVIIFTSTSYLGLNKGIKRLANLNSLIFYLLLIVLLITGPTSYILETSFEAIKEWSSNFFLWNTEPITKDSEALTMWWTLFNWSVWIAYAPLMGIFLAKIAYGRTIREFIIINWILPSVFAIFWFSVWGGTALFMEIQGQAELLLALKENRSVAGLWIFIQNFPFGIGKFIVPIIIITLLLSYSTAADAMSSSVAGLCSKQLDKDGEPEPFLKIIFGIIIGFTAIVAGAFTGGVRGVDGTRQLASVGGFLVLFIFILQVISFIKVFFLNKDNFH